MEEVSEIINKFETKTDGDGLTYTIVPKGTAIYRGDPTRYYGAQETDHSGSPLPKKEMYNKETLLYSNNDEKLAGHKYFGFTEKNVIEYGKTSPSESVSIIYKFFCNDDMKLLRIDNVETKGKLLSDTDNDSHRDINIIIKDFFGGENSNIRKSDPSKDGQLANYVCSMGCDGYMIGTEMKTVENNEFTPEMAVCEKAFDKLDYNNDRLEYRDNDMTEADSDAISEGNKNTEVQRNKDDGKNSSIFKRLFDGGKRKKNKESKKVNTNKKTKKTKKTKYGGNSYENGSWVPFENIKPDEVCAICQDPLQSSEQIADKGLIYQLSCGHQFHNNCLSGWCDNRIKSVKLPNRNEEIHRPATLFKCPVCNQLTLHEEHDCTPMEAYRDKFLKKKQRGQYTTEEYTGIKSESKPRNMFNFFKKGGKRKIGKTKKKKKTKNRQNKSKKTENKKDK